MRHSVLMALSSDQGCSVLGVGYVPEIDCVYWGGVGAEAFRMLGNDSASIWVRLNGSHEPCNVVVSKRHLNAETQSCIDRLVPTCKSGTVARQAVLEGADCSVVDQNGFSLSYGNPGVFNLSSIATRDLALIPA